MALPCFIGTMTDNNTIIIENEEFHHAIDVKRLTINNKIEINDLNGNYYIAVIEEIQKKRAYARVLKKIKKITPSIETTLYQCLTNNLSKIDGIIESASQLNVSQFIPVLSQYSEHKIQDIQKKLYKWQKLSIQSIKQCKRLLPLKIGEPQKLSQLTFHQDLKIVCYENEATHKITNIVPRPKNVAVLVGPEGGFSKDEIFILLQKGFMTIKLSENILRTELATIVVISQLNLILDSFPAI